MKKMTIIAKKALNMGTASEVGVAETARKVGLRARRHADGRRKGC